MSNSTPTITVTRRCSIPVKMTGLEQTLARAIDGLRSCHSDTLADVLAMLIRYSPLDGGSVNISGFSARWGRRDTGDEGSHLVVDMEAEGRENQYSSA